MPDPIAVYDTTGGWTPVPGLTEWAIQQGLDPRAIYRLEIHPGPVARVFEYVKDDKGKIRVLGEEPMRREPYDIPLTSLPPGVTV